MSLLQVLKKAFAMDVTPRKRAQVVALRKHSKLTIRTIGEWLGLAQSTLGRIAKMAESDNDVHITVEEDVEKKEDNYKCW